MNYWSYTPYIHGINILIMYKRALKLPKNPEESIFLWGPRQAGKSSLLKELYPDSLYIDLLKNEEFIRYKEKPYLLRQEIELAVQNETLESNTIVIDEIQLIPSLLNEIHWLIENCNYHSEKLKFIMCGSSARKVRRGHANLLGGRALRYELHGLSAIELADDFDISKILNRGYLPRHYSSSKYNSLIRSYIDVYLKEEILAESLVRDLPTFSNFLNAVALTDTEIVNYNNIASDCGVSSKTAKEYFQILIDTLLADYLPAYTKKPKRRIIQSPKFYYSDVAIVNHLTKRKNLEPGSFDFGKAFENWVFHELKTYRAYNEFEIDLSYWRLTTGVEVDFIINDMQVAIEVKATENINNKHLKGLRELIKDHPNVEKLVIVCLENKSRITDDKIQILSIKDFVKMLWSHKLV